MGRPGPERPVLGLPVPGWLVRGRSVPGRSVLGWSVLGWSVLGMVARLRAGAGRHRVRRTGTGPSERGVVRPEPMGVRGGRTRRWPAVLPRTAGEDPAGRWPAVVTGRGQVHRCSGCCGSGGVR